MTILDNHGECVVALNAAGERIEQLESALRQIDPALFAQIGLIMVVSFAATGLVNGGLGLLLLGSGYGVWTLGDWARPNLVGALFLLLGLLGWGGGVWLCFAIT